MEDLERQAIERSQLENSDLVISPSSYLLEYYIKSGVSLPESAVINWMLPQWFSNPDGLRDTALSTREIAPNTVSELIFFGRHERRKGFEIFVDAIGQLPMAAKPDVTFVGRFDRVGREFSGSHVFRKLQNYPGRIRFFNQLNQEEALSYILNARNALCVMPSLIENSPCVIGECFSIGVPFITTNVGGVTELIDPTSAKSCVVPPMASTLAKAIERVISDGMPALRSSLTPTRIAQEWRDKFQELDNRIVVATEKQPSAQPLVSVCMTHYERPDYLHQAIERLMEQTYDKIEIIVVDDGSKGADTHAYLDRLERTKLRFPIKVIRSENKYLGAARNLAAKHAYGDYLLFHDDDNLAEPTEVESFVSASLHSGCHILTSQYWVFREGSDESVKKKMEYYPIGIGGAFSFFRNRFGDANALVNRSVFEQLGGFTELHSVGWEDWELFLRAFLRGFKMGVVPEPLFNYRVSAGSMLGTTSPVRNFERLYALVDQEMPRMNSDLLRYVQRDFVQKQELDQLWARLEKCPGRDLHQQLTALDPNSIEARTKLSDLAFELGRVADAIELGVMDFAQREKIFSLVSHMNSAGGSCGKQDDLRHAQVAPGRPGGCHEGLGVRAERTPRDTEDFRSRR